MARIGQGVSGKLFSYRTLLIMATMLAIFFFFYNLGLYSDRLCENKAREMEAEMNSMANKMLSELRKVEMEKKVLEEQVQYYQDQMGSKSELLSKAEDSLQIPVLIFAYNRPEYLQKALTSVLKYGGNYNSTHSFIATLQKDNFPSMSLRYVIAFVRRSCCFYTPLVIWTQCSYRMEVLKK